MTDYTVADPAQDTVSFSLASVMNQANQANAYATYVGKQFPCGFLDPSFFPMDHFTSYGLNITL